MANQTTVTKLLNLFSAGDQQALIELVPMVHDELKRIARNKLRHERRGHTLNTTALVNEAYLKLVEAENLHLESRAHFLAIAAKAMRNILVSYARRRKSVKRGGAAVHVSLSEAADHPAAEEDRILELDAALHHLSELNSRHARIVECRFFGGMTIEETASVLGVSIATVKRDWDFLRLWLQRELESGKA